jgi:hypothetical protein
MSTGLIIAIVIVVLLLIGLLVLMPRMRAKAEERKAAKELGSRRERVATEHREEASTRSSRAERAEQEAALAQKNAQVERAQAERHEQEAQLHDRGLADDKLIDDDERERFDGVSGNTATADRDERAEGDDRGAVRDGTTGAGSDANTEYEQGREDERETRR